jgi:micrococcal nuclease
MSAALMVFVACLATDGDSLVCDGQRVRLLKIDSPEWYEAGYQEAKDHMRLLIQGKRVTCIVAARDKFHRLLGACRTDATPDLGDEMLRGGHAIKYSQRCHGRQAECKPQVSPPP